MIARSLLGIVILAVTAGTYSFLAWTAAARFGRRALFFVWPAASLLLVGCYLTAQPHRPGFLPAHAYAIGVFAVFLAFGLSTRSLWRRLATPAASPVLGLSAIVGATGAFFVGLILGLLPLLVLDMLTVARRT
jgi:hypothetical protein